MAHIGSKLLTAVFSLFSRRYSTNGCSRKGDKLFVGHALGYGKNTISHLQNRLDQAPGRRPTYSSNTHDQQTAQQDGRQSCIVNGPKRLGSLTIHKLSQPEPHSAIVVGLKPHGGGLASPVLRLIPAPAEYSGRGGFRLLTIRVEFALPSRDGSSKAQVPPPLKCSCGIGQLTATPPRLASFSSAVPSCLVNALWNIKIPRAQLCTQARTNPSGTAGG